MSKNYTLQIVHIFLQLANGILHLHNLNIVHGDLKPENILIDHRMNVKICDMGMSYFEDSANLKMKEYGTPMICAPELNKSQPVSGFFVDVFALGFTLYSMFHGPGNMPKEVQRVDTRADDGFYPISEWSNGMNESLKKLIQSMTMIDPNKRMVVSDIVTNLGQIVV
jgi:serine/threonine-protein kinase GIN4